MKDKRTFTVDNNFVVKTWDSGMEKLCYKSAQDVVGDKVSDVFPLLHDEIARVLSKGKNKQIKKFKNNCFRGTNFTFDLQIKPIKDKKGEIKGASIVLYNISGDCPVEKKLTESERIIAIGKMASTLAHGVRNPLNAIKGAVVYLTEKYGHEPTLLEFSTIINDEIGRLDNFVSNFLSASRGETKFIPINLNDILKTILVMIKPRTETQNIRISHNFSVLPLITADPFQTEQALFNIINNAIEAMPNGGLINIKSSLTREHNCDCALVEISDTGKGIPQKARKRLGELSKNPERNDRGFGIFLSREIIKTHNGKLMWESAKAKGTTFKIFLPVSQDG